MEIMAETSTIDLKLDVDANVKRIEKIGSRNDSNDDLLCELIGKVKLQDDIDNSASDEVNEIKFQSLTIRCVEKNVDLAGNIDEKDTNEIKNFDVTVSTLDKDYDVPIDCHPPKPADTTNTCSKLPVNSNGPCDGEQIIKTELKKGDLAGRGPIAGIPVDGFLSADDVSDYLKDLPTSDKCPSSKYRRPNNVDNQALPNQNVENWQPILPQHDWKPVPLQNGNSWLPVTLQTGLPVACEMINTMPYVPWNNSEPWMSNNGSRKVGTLMENPFQLSQLPSVKTYLLGPASKPDFLSSSNTIYNPATSVNSFNFQALSCGQPICASSFQNPISTMPYFPVSVNVKEISSPEPVKAFFKNCDAGFNDCSFPTDVTCNIADQLKGSDACIDSSGIIESDDADWLFNEIGHDMTDIFDLGFTDNSTTDATLLNEISENFEKKPGSFVYTDFLTACPLLVSGSTEPGSVLSQQSGSPPNSMSSCFDQAQQSPSSSIKSHGSPDSGISEGNYEEGCEQEFNGGSIDEIIGIPATVVDKWNEPDTINDDCQPQGTRLKIGSAQRAAKHKIAPVASVSKNCNAIDGRLIYPSCDLSGSNVKSAVLPPVLNNEGIVCGQGADTRVRDPPLRRKSDKSKVKPVAAAVRQRSILPSPSVRVQEIKSSQQMKESFSQVLPKSGEVLSGALPILPVVPSVLPVTTTRSTTVPAAAPFATTVTSPRGQINTDPAPLKHTSSDIKIYRQVAGLQRARLLQPNHEGFTILDIAVSQGNAKLVEALLDRLSRESLLEEALNAVNHQNQTPLSLAVILNHPSIVRQLIERGADVNVTMRKPLPNADGSVAHYRPLHVAASNGVNSEATLQELIAAKNIDLDAVNYQGLTALHTAVNVHGTRSDTNGELINSRSVIYLLAQRGANLNMADSLAGNTALHYIVEKRDPSLVNWYLDLVSHLHQTRSGSSRSSQSKSTIQPRDVVNARTGAGYTAVQLVSELEMNSSTRDEIIRLLIVNGAFDEGPKDYVRRV